MTKEEIRGVFIKYLYDNDYTVDCALKDLSELGVVIKNSRSWLEPLDALAVEPLIGEVP